MISHNCHRISFRLSVLEPVRKRIISPSVEAIQSRAKGWVDRSGLPSLRSHRKLRSMRSILSSQPEIRKRVGVQQKRAPNDSTGL
jgi:hypothetical protein